VPDCEILGRHREQWQQVLGRDTVKQLAMRFNIPVDQPTKVLAQQVPKAWITQV
jgi:uncharacterized protein YidB (DUF937 family)